MSLFTDGFFEDGLALLGFTFSSGRTDARQLTQRWRIGAIADFSSSAAEFINAKVT